jgi:FtsP/CotA-like multicopper oxidase with cupredoxin domain
MPHPTRREFLKYGVGGAAASALLKAGAARSDDLDIPRSPRTTPFLDPLPIPPTARRVAPFPSPTWNDFVDPTETHYYELVAEEALVRFHSQLPPTRVWRFRDASVPHDQYPAIVAGPTFKTTIVPRHQQGNLLRIVNGLPAGHVGFGNTDMTVHFHGGHQPSLSDGFPEDTVFDGFPIHFVFPVGQQFDYFFPMTDVGVGISGFGPTNPDISERPSTLWYHDHLLDFTAPNNYRGLQGFYLVFEDPGELDVALDTGNERDPNPQALRLPSGPFDIPLILQDRAFADDGSLVFNQFNFDGFLGDKYLVNGKIQPFLRVKRRKYRFRVLNGANARWFFVWLADSTGRTYPMMRIATDSRLLAFPIQVESVLVGSAMRVEVVIDFADPRFDSLTELFLENRLEQDDGRGPGGDFEEPDLLDKPMPLLKFILEERVDDPSRVPDTLRPLEAIGQDLINQATIREFVFKREGGLWTINERLMDPRDPIVRVKAEAPQIFRFVNNSGGWWHPIHTHLELGRMLSRNGKQPAFFERDGVAATDTVALGPNDVVDVFRRFRDYCGVFVFHCHNLAHEDHAMMARFDVVGNVPGDCFFRPSAI